MAEAYSLAGKRVFVAGHKGMVGAAVVRRLSREDCETLTADRAEVDLRDQAAVRAFMAREKPDAVVIAAAKVGGIHANNSYPADFLYDNLILEANLIEAAYREGVEKLVFLGSSCIYPRAAAQPMREEALLTGPLEPTNEWYAVAKIAGIKLAQAYRKQHGCDFISGMPTNLYGPGDNFDLETSHVLPALMRKIHEAKETGADHVVLWGSGTPLREFLHVDDCADAIVFMLKSYSGHEHLNIGSGEEVSIKALAQHLARVIGFHGRFEHDLDKPDGTPRKLMDSAKLRGLGWAPRYSLEEGIERTYAWFLDNRARLRA